MAEREWQIGVVGTFDVENYGDLLFPLIAKAELTERLGRVRLRPFSYGTRTVADWPYAVTSVAELPRLAPDLDGLLVGGGFLIRFDKDVAPGYLAPAGVSHPTGYWLSPALIALQHGVPLVWNAPGMHCNDVPDWAEPLLRLAFGHSAYIAVRDEPSRAALARFASREPIAVLPDTGFGVGRLLAARRAPDGEFTHFRESHGLKRPYIVVQAATGIAPCLRFLARHEEQLRDFAVLALEIAPVLGEDAAIVQAELPASVRLPSWPEPLRIAELISNASAVIGHSYHLAITALTAGVPVFSPSGLIGKYSAFAGIDTIYPLPGADDTDIATFRSRLGRIEPTDRAGGPAQVENALKQLTAHWDRVASAIRGGRTASPEALSSFLLALPGILEDSRSPSKGAPSST